MDFEVICDMPNTEPALIDRKVLLKRLAAAEKAKSKTKYMTWVGLTKDPEQIKEAVSLWKEYPEVVGLKMFAGKSTGNLAIIRREDQRIVYETLAKLGYAGAIAVHCEEEKYINLRLYKENEPWTWAIARPKKSETFSVMQQLDLITQTGFAGAPARLPCLVL
jgi:dihydroorotase